MSKEQLDFILQVSAENPPPENAGPAEMRVWFEAINEQTPIAEGAMIENLSVGPCGAEMIRMPDTRPGQLLIFYHGGGFLFGSPRSHRVIASNLARASGAAVLRVDYRLAPEHPAPAAHDDCHAAYRWALDQGYAPSSIALCGDSAGGNMALATAVRARDEGLPLPACVVLMSPALDLADDGDSHRSVVDAPLLTPELMGLFNMIYIGDGDRRSPTVTPFYSDMAGLPPVLVHVGSWEILHDDSITIAERISAAGGTAELKIWDGMVHSWQLFAPMLDEGMASIDEAGAFVKKHLNS
ncbi:alpha/beta hydrolase [Roseibium aggregatum]|uniref:Alpha/beta hydrolase n=1 Tax=Roseibium aggregatum TaxID=187304 RepID=A0A926S8J4_9HYPH|nr:alpha/beta hydrolase [Roseibium aggregatum]MBD1549640.1 alpha/beta hydrolase [Roseibium aggregatum]